MRTIFMTGMLMLLGGATTFATQVSESVPRESDNSLVAITIGWVALLAIFFLLRKHRA